MGGVVNGLDGGVEVHVIHVLSKHLAGFRRLSVKRVDQGVQFVGDGLVFRLRRRVADG